MVKKLIVSLGLTLLAIAPLRADVTYTLHMEVRAAKGGATDPLSQMAGGMLSQMFPAGGIDQVVMSSDRGSRSEQKQAFATVKAGAVTLIRPDGSMVMMDPSTKTYWKQPAMSAAVTEALAGAKPAVKVTKRGEFETINGMKAEHLTLVMTMSLPGLDPAQLPPGMSPDLSMTYDVWLTDAVKTSGGTASLSASMMKQFGMGDVRELNDGRLMLKGVMSMFGIEIVMTASGLTSESVPAAMFDVPADYKEVPNPIK